MSAFCDTEIIHDSRAQVRGGQGGGHEPGGAGDPGSGATNQPTIGDLAVGITSVVGPTTWPAAT